MFMIAPVLAWFGSAVGKYLTDQTLKMIAWKALIFTFLTVTFPIVIKNLVFWLFNLASSKVSEIDMGGIGQTVYSLSGVGAYLAVHLNLVDALAIILTAIMIRFVLNMIPFVG